MNRLVDIHASPCDGCCAPHSRGCIRGMRPVRRSTIRPWPQPTWSARLGWTMPRMSTARLRESIFRSQLSIAATLRKPVVIHCVRAFEPVMKILSGIPACGRGDARLHRLARAGCPRPRQGYMLSFGMRTFSSPKTLRALHATPLDRMFCETDDFPHAYRRGISPHCRGARHNARGAGRTTLYQLFETIRQR